jgi:hypothetical protein
MAFRKLLEGRKIRGQIDRHVSNLDPFDEKNYSDSKVV